MRYAEDIRESRKLDENQRGGINKSCTRRQGGSGGSGGGGCVGGCWLTQLPRIIAADRKRKVFAEVAQPLASFCLRRR